MASVPSARGAGCEAAMFSDAKQNGTPFFNGFLGSLAGRSLCTGTFDRDMAAQLLDLRADGTEAIPLPKDSRLAIE